MGLENANASSVPTQGGKEMERMFVSRGTIRAIASLQVSTSRQLGKIRLTELSGGCARVHRAPGRVVFQKQLSRL